MIHNRPQYKLKEHYKFNYIAKYFKQPMTHKPKAPYIPQAWEKVNCPFCEANDSRLYERTGSDFQYTYVCCKNCGLIYQNPRPVYNQHFIDAAYADYYQYAENLSLNDLAKVQESSYDMFKEEVRYISAFDKRKSAVLDIGSGMGTFLFAAKDLYPKAIGLDVSVKMAEFIEKNMGLKVYVEQLESFSYPEKFSLIHMSHVIEHIPNPNVWLEKAKEFMYDDSILVVNVPNKFALGARVKHFLYKWGIRKRISSGMKDPSRTPDHLYEPTVRSLEIMLKKHNYDILELYTYSRKDPTSTKSFFSKLMNRRLRVGTNIAAICKLA
jgi:SAM-dependent methyltransferase